MKDDMVNTIYKNETGQALIPQLKIIKLGGDVGATKNMTVYECGDDILIVDCGIGFPDSELYGVDVVIPDITYVRDRKDKLRGIFITHAHEDHIGGVPFALDDLKVPVYGGKLALGLIKEKLKEHFPNGIVTGVSFNEVSTDAPEIVLGNFRVKAFRLNHSVPGGVGYAISTPQGVVLHIPDYKIDFTPVLDKPIELGKIANYGDKGVLCLLSDCLGVTHEGYAKSEQTLNETFSLIFEKAEGRQILITTISSNISRMYQIIDAAVKHGRKVVFSGRSINQSSTVARELGYLPFGPEVFVTDKASKSYKQSDLVYIIAGCYGQPGSGLERLSRQDHSLIRIEKNSLVIFSADPNPPGVQEDVEKLLHNLTLAGAELMYNETHSNLHVSGHGLRGDLMTVTSLSKAKYYIPIGGTAAHMRAYTIMVETLGIKRDNVFELLEGEALIFENGEGKRTEKVEVKPIYISGRKRGELSPIVVRDREQLSSEGVFVVMIPVDKKGNFFADRLEIVTRGFVYVKDSQELMNKSRNFVKERLNKLQSSRKDKDWGSLKRKLENDINKMLYKETGREPLTIIHTILC